MFSVKLFPLGSEVEAAKTGPWKSMPEDCGVGGKLERNADDDEDREVVVDDDK